MTDPIAAARALIAAQPDLLFLCVLCSEECNCHPHHDMSMSGEYILCDSCGGFDNPKGVPDPLQLIATLADALEVEREHAEKAEAERDQALARLAVHAATKPMVDAAFKALPPDACGMIGSGEMYRVLDAALKAEPPADAQAALDKKLAEARAMESKRADTLMRERDDALMRLGSLTEHLARLAEAKDHADGEPETDFDRGYDQAGDEIAAMIRDTEHNAQIIVGEMLAEARLEGWRAGQVDMQSQAYDACREWMRNDDSRRVEDVILALPEPKENSHA